MRVRVFDQARRDLHDMAAVPPLHLCDGELCNVKEAREVDPEHSGIVGLGILSEGLGDEYAGVVDKRIYAPKPGQAFGDRTLGRFTVGNVAGHYQDLVIVGWPDRPCCRDHRIIAIAIGFDKRCANALRGARDDGNVPITAHAGLLYPSRIVDWARQKHASARMVSIVARRSRIGRELVFVRCSLPFTVTAPRYCSPSTPVERAGPQTAVSSISRARVAYGITPTLESEPCDAKLACMKSDTVAGVCPMLRKPLICFDISVATSLDCAGRTAALQYRARSQRSGP